MQGTALAAVLAGSLAGHMQDKRGWDALQTRTLCQDIATVGKLFAACFFIAVIWKPDLEMHHVYHSFSVFTV